jgi:hypothetical protein
MVKFQSVIFPWFLGQESYVDPKGCPKVVNSRPNSRRRLRHKAIVRVPSDSGDMDAPSRQIEKEKQIAGAKTSHSPGFDGEEVRAIR